MQNVIRVNILKQYGMFFYTARYGLLARMISGVDGPERGELRRHGIHESWSGDGKRAGAEVAGQGKRCGKSNGVSGLRENLGFLERLEAARSWRCRGVAVRGGSGRVAKRGRGMERVGEGGALRKEI